MVFSWAIALIGLAIYMLVGMCLVKAEEREWRDFGIFWIVVLAVIGAAHVISATWEILER